MNLFVLIIAVVSLAVGPVLARLVESSRWRTAGDMVMKALVVSLCLFHLGPHAVTHGGWAVAVAVLVGVALPAALHQIDLAGGWMWPVVALVALLVHAALDGAALAVAEAGVDVSMAAAIVAHRVPVGLAVFEGAAHEPPDGHHPGRGWMAIGALMVATALGFAGSTALAHTLGETARGLLEGFVIGAVLHVVLVPHPEPEDVLA